MATLVGEFESSGIKFRVFIYEFCEPGDEVYAVVIQFVGSYGYGSAGNGDAQYMIAIREYILECINLNAFVFDLRELDYEWGNAIWWLFSLHPDDPPFATIVSERCKGFQTCGVARPMFETLESALEFLRPLAIEHDRAMGE